MGRRTSRFLKSKVQLQWRGRRNLTSSWRGLWWGSSRPATSSTSTWSPTMASIIPRTRSTEESRRVVEVGLRAPHCFQPRLPFPDLLPASPIFPPLPPTHQRAVWYRRRTPRPGRWRRRAPTWWSSSSPSSPLPAPLASGLSARAGRERTCRAAAWRQARRQMWKERLTMCFPPRQSSPSLHLRGKPRWRFQRSRLVHNTQSLRTRW